MSSTGCDEALARLLDEGRVRATAIDPHHAALWDALAAATEDGKRLRPQLVVATHDALGGSMPLVAAEVGAAVELLHTAFVIHDDVIDDDHLRRGRPNVSGTFRDAAHRGGAGPEAMGAYGLTAAILAGDLALAASVRAVATCGAPPDVVHCLLDLFDVALHTTASGELADVRLTMAHHEVSLAESLAMEEQKTSAYSFSLPLQAGAVLAGAAEPVVARLGEAGRCMGLAFQLVDDLIGVFGDPARSGKSTTSDLRAGKQTPLLVHARTTAEWEQVRHLVGRDLDDDDLARVRELLTASGSRAFVEDLAAQHLSAARATVDEAGVPVELLDDLEASTSVLVGGREAAA